MQRLIPPRQAPVVKPVDNSSVIVYTEVVDDEIKTEGTDPTCGGNYLPPLKDSRMLWRVPRSLRHGGSKASRPIETWMSFYFKQAGAANTAFAFSQPLEPNLDASFADYQGVFSEMKVLAAEVWWKVNMTVLPTVFAAQSPNAALAYDPEYTGSIAPSSVNQILEYEKFSLCSVVPVNGGAFTYSTNIQEVTGSGFRPFRLTVPPDPSQSESSTLLSTGMWRPTMDTQNYYWGSIVGYCAQAGTTSVCQIEAFVRMRVAFKTRR